jgi:hypothetical protein
VLIGQVEIEVKCRSKRCGAEPGVLVLHRFDSSTGQYLGTKRYRELESRKD